MIELKIKDYTGCGICGGKLVWIRGKYPKDDRREICPTCAYERLETIHEMTNKDCAKAYTDGAIVQE